MHVHRTYTTDESHTFTNSVRRYCISTAYRAAVFYQCSLRVVLVIILPTHLLLVLTPLLKPASTPKLLRGCIQCTCLSASAAPVVTVRVQYARLAWPCLVPCVCGPWLLTLRRSSLHVRRSALLPLRKQLDDAWFQHTLICSALDILAAVLFFSIPSRMRSFTTQVRFCMPYASYST